MIAEKIFLNEIRQNQDDKLPALSYLWLPPSESLQVSTLPEVTAEYKKDKGDHGGGGKESRTLGHKWSERGNGKCMTFN